MKTSQHSIPETEAQGELLAKLGEARSHARDLESMHRVNGSKLWENPSSQVWKFVDRLALLSEVGDG